ncbi:hypothetical protein OIU85_018951 [Salix viminalis]|uniref:Uncharacterized protein n=1 Tax=Salix viminalis TaxID=40686 RepID=A0A9Q0UVD3_SALVM|nr:hypothetical protein OIU85_018951 [Salix viminalis]
MPIWIRYKKILVEEGHSIPNLIHIFELVVAIRISSTAAEHNLFPKWSILDRLDCHSTLQQQDTCHRTSFGLVVGYGKGKGNMK